MTVEYRVKTEARGRIADEWKLKAVRPENRCFDCLVVAAVAAGIQGLRLFGTDDG